MPQELGDQRLVIRGPSETLCPEDQWNSDRDLSKRDYKIDLAQLISDKEFEKALVPVQEKDLRRRGYLLAFSEEGSKVVVFIPGKTEADDRVLELGVENLVNFGTTLPDLTPSKGYLRSLQRRGYGKEVERIRRELLDFKSRSLGADARKSEK